MLCVVTTVRNVCSYENHFKYHTTNGRLKEYNHVDFPLVLYGFQTLYLTKRCEYSLYIEGVWEQSTEDNICTQDLESGEESTSRASSFPVFSRCYEAHKIKVNHMGGACDTNGRYEKRIHFILKSWVEERIWWVGRRTNEPQGNRGAGITQSL
jgi:hypothetical protein